MDKSLGDLIAKAIVSLAPPASVARVVEVEAGLGALTLLLARHAAHVEAIDSSGAIVKALRARLAVARAGNVEARTGDPEALPVVEHTFDGAYCANVTVARERVLPELRRVLKPGARAVVAGADDRDALVEDMALAGFDEVTAHAVAGTRAWLAIGIA